MRSHRFLALGSLILLGALTVPSQAQELPLGSPLPLADRAFAAVDGPGRPLAQYAGPKGLAVVFWANRCVWVDRHEQRLNDLAAAYGPDYGVVLVGTGTAAENGERARAKAYAVPYLSDPAGELAKALGAARAPQAFVFDAAGSLVYVGAFDDSPSDPAAASRRYLHDALDAGRSGATAPTTRTEALGCLLRPTSTPAPAAGN